MILDDVLKRAKEKSSNVLGTEVVTIATLEEIINSVRDKDTEPTTTKYKPIDFRDCKSAGLSEKDIKFRKKWEFKGKELGLLLNEISTQLSDGHYEGCEEWDKQFADWIHDFWHYFEFASRDGKSFIYYVTPNKYDDKRDKFYQDKTDIECLEYLFGVAKYVVDDLDYMDKDDTFEHEALTTLSDRLKEMKKKELLVNFDSDFMKTYSI